MLRVVDIVRVLAPLAKANYLSAFESADSLLKEHEVTTPARVAHFLAQVLHESGGLRHERENMNYRAERLLEIFGERHSARITPNEARRLAGKPEAIAERVYGLGNPTKAAELGNVRAGDGYAYRGGGLFQTTGRSNYRRMSEITGVSFEENPELVVSPEHALKPALAEWSEKRLNAFADAGDMLAISRAINIGNARSSATPNGLADRKNWLERAMARMPDAIGFVGTEDAAAPGTPAIPALDLAPRSMDLSEIQRRLKEVGLYGGEIDGIYGPKTATAIKALFLNQAVGGYEAWPELRWVLAAAQLFCRMDGIEVGLIDGLLGPQTQEAFEAYSRRGGAADGVWRDELFIPMMANGTSRSQAAKNTAGWPDEQGVPDFFGMPGSGQKLLTLPFPMRLAWDLDTMVSRTSCNAKVYEPLERIWKRTLDHYGIGEIRRLRLDLFGGCLNVRKKRGGSSWSMHAYGIAWDVDPARNGLRMSRDEASLDAPDYDAFWDFVYDEDAISLGRERDYDWMHFQFARL